MFTLGKGKPLLCFSGAMGTATVWQWRPGIVVSSVQGDDATHAAPLIPALPHPLILSLYTKCLCSLQRGSVSRRVIIFSRKCLKMDCTWSDVCVCTCVCWPLAGWPSLQWGEIGGMLVLLLVPNSSRAEDVLSLVPRDIRDRSAEIRGPNISGEFQWEGMKIAG